jgi:RNA polymerase sigma-70 factor (ECF subfamily)
VNNQPSRHVLFLRSFTTNEATIRAYVRRLLPSRTDADDVMQGVALVLWDKFDQFREGSDFRSWAFGVARYEVLGWLRDHGRDRLVLAGDVIELIATEALEQETRFEQSRDALEKCLTKIGPRNRQLLLESYRPESKISDVAASSGRSTGAFYQWLHRMRRILLNCIEQELAR